MDPLSISASIAGLVSLADLVYRASTKYLRSFKGAREEVQNLSREIRSLSVVLHNLSLVAFDLEESQSPDGSQQASGLKPHHLHDCQQLLMKLENSLFDKETQLNTKSRHERLKGRLKWPFSSDETKELIQDLQRHKQTIDLALGAESLSKLKVLLSRQSDTNDRVEKVQLTVDELLKVQKKIAEDKRHNGVLDVFEKASPHREFETNRKLRHDLTGLWLTEGPDFQDWYTTPGSKIWFTGIPGAGKSVLAAAIIEECLRRNSVHPGTGLAYFFCTYRDESTHGVTAILSSLCAQLALQNESAFRTLEEYYVELRSDRSFPREPSAEGLTKVLHSMCTVYSRVFLVVDGLDECGDQVATSVRKLAALATSQVDGVMSLALLSRNEIVIREILEDRFQNVEIAAHTEDILLYVASELEQRITRRELRLRDLSVKDQILNRLVDGAKGMFRWVACQLDHLCDLPTDGARKKALDKLPPTLFATYERILMRIEGYSDDVKQMVQRMLLLIGSPSPQERDTLKFQDMCEVISLADGSDTLYEDEIVEKAEVLRWCSSLVRTSQKDRNIEFAHFSVQEYLQGECFKHPILNVYGVSEEKACKVLGSLYIRYLTLKNHERPPEHEEDEIKRIRKRRQKHPLYEYVSIYWPYYLHQDATGEGWPAHLCHALFQLSKTPSFCTWAVELILHLAEPKPHGRFRQGGLRRDPRSDDSATLAILSAVLRPDFTPLHMAAALWMPDLCRHLLNEGANPSSRSKFGSPLHCAIGGLSVFTRRTEFIDTNQFFAPVLPPLFVRRAAQRQTVQLLLEAGSSTHLRFTTPLWASSVSTLSLATISSDIDCDFELIADLVESGVAVLDEDLPHFQDHYNNCIKYCPAVVDKSFNGKRGFVKLLNIIGHQTTTGTPESRLYNETLTFVRHMKIEAPHQLLYPTHNATDEDLSKFLEIWIKDNNVLELERFLGTGRSELVRRFRFDPALGSGWTALHLATNCRSLEVLNVLLSIGIDPNMAATDGTTPIHICADVDVLRALLQHGASTLIPDEENMTIWHYNPDRWFTYPLDQLVELDERDIALQMVSSKNETPICAALNLRQEKYVSTFLKYCTSKEFWKSRKSIFREAASQGLSAVIQTLLDAGVEPDGMDTYSGNPLHFLSNDIDLDCVLMLKKLFPLAQRREKDNLTPAELMLTQSLNDRAKRKKEIFTALLPPSALLDGGEASALWSFACSTSISFVMDYMEPRESTAMANEVGAIGSETRSWIRCLLVTLIELGVAKLYEEETESSALVPFVSKLTDKTPRIYESLKRSYHKIPKLGIWGWFSGIVKSMMEMTHRLASVAHEHYLVRLLSEAVRHDDSQMIYTLVTSGVDMHSRVDELSPLDCACLPNVRISESGFDLLVAHARPEQISLGIHYTAGLVSKRNGSVSKLRRLLQTGIDCNLPMSAEYGSPLIYHISQGANNTAHLLLDAGADPWARGKYLFNAPLAAVAAGEVLILAKIAAMYQGNNLPHHWDQSWTAKIDGKEFFGGNTLHLAALMGRRECLELYLDQNLLNDLEAVDGDLETPMHYAARSNSSSVIALLKGRGGNINPKNRFGLTPLHLAIQSQHLDSVRTLVDLGAKHSCCHAGRTPLTCAYQTGNASIIEVLSKSLDASAGLDAKAIPPKLLRQLARRLERAILRGDTADCERIHALGCPIDIELGDSERVTPLTLAICRQKRLGPIEWLLDNGATVSTRFSTVYLNRFDNTLEAAVAKPRLNPLLPCLLTRFLDEGGDFLELQRSPLDVAVKYGNSEGLGILLDCLRDACGSQDDSAINTASSHRDSASRTNMLAAYVNQCDALWPHDSVLHAAARSHKVELTKKLVENGAKIEQVNGYNATPLHIAADVGSLEVVKYLLECGARPDALNGFDCTPLMVACSQGRWEVMDALAQYCQSGMGTDSAGRSILHILIQYAGADGATPNYRIFHQCLEKEVDLHRMNAFGSSAIHGLLMSPTAVYLRSLLNRDARLLQPQRMAAWSDRVFWGNVGAIHTLAKRFRWLSPFMTKEDMYHLSGLASPGNHSLMCRAACWGSVEVIDNFIASGVDDLEHRCADHGTPLNAAVLKLRIEAVKALVRHGAQVPCQLSSPRDSEISMANPEFVIRQWLFVGRYLERKGITEGTAGDAARVRGWAGPLTAQVALKWEWRKANDETMLEYASRRQKILKDLRGKVIKPVGCMD